MTSLYAATVPTFRQMIGATRGVVAKGEAFAAESGIDPADLIERRLAPDMLPFGYQVKSVRHHSIGAIAGVRAGVFNPDMSPWPTDFVGLTALLDDTDAAVAALTPDEIDGFAGRDVEFRFRDRALPFTAEDFLLSFSLPNFYFHATTAYAILRAAGVTLGKLDYMGRARVKG